MPRQQDVRPHLLADAGVRVTDGSTFDDDVEDLTDLGRRRVVVQDTRDQAHAGLDVRIAESTLSQFLAQLYRTVPS